MSQLGRVAVITFLSAINFAAVSSAVSAETIDVVGTGDGMAILESIGEAFSAANPGVKIAVPESIGSGGAIKAVGNDQNAIGRVARGIKDKEQGYGLTYVPFAKIPVVFFVNDAVDVTDLTAEQVVSIYTGKVTDWSEVGGSSGKIRVVRREEGDSSLSVLEKSFPGFDGIEMTSKSKEALSTTENFEVVEGTKGAIGFGPYAGAKIRDVKILSIGGVAAGDAAYPSVTTLGLVFKEGSKTGDIQKFVEFATSPAAHEAIKQAHGFPGS